MAFLLRKPYIYLIIGILLVIVIIFFSGIFGPEQFGLVLIVSPISSSIQMGQNTTIAAIIENTAPHKQTYEFRIVYTSTNLSYYNGITKEPLVIPVYNGINYTLIYLNDTLGPNENAELQVIIEGDLPLGVSSKRYTVFFEVYAVEDASKYLSDRKSISLTVTHVPP
jgi:hypothetical protein